MNQNFISSYVNVQPISPSITLTEMDSLNQPIKTVLLKSPSFNHFDISPSWDKFIQTSDSKSVTPFSHLEHQITKADKINFPSLNVFSLLNNNPVSQNIPNSKNFNFIKPNNSDSFDNKVPNQAKSHLNQPDFMTSQQSSASYELAPSTFPIQSKQERVETLMKQMTEQDNMLNLTSKMKNELNETKFNQKSKNNVDPLLNSLTFAYTFLDTSSGATNVSKEFPSLSCLGDSFDDHLIDEINVDDLLK